MCVRFICHIYLGGLLLILIIHQKVKIIFKKIQSRLNVLINFLLCKKNQTRWNSSPHTLKGMSKIHEAIYMIVLAFLSFLIK